MELAEVEYENLSFIARFCFQNAILKPCELQWGQLLEEIWYDHTISKESKHEILLTEAE